MSEWNINHQNDWLSSLFLRVTNMKLRNAQKRFSNFRNNALIYSGGTQKSVRTKWASERRKFKLNASLMWAPPIETTIPFSITIQSLVFLFLRLLMTLRFVLCGEVICTATHASEMRRQGLAVYYGEMRIQLYSFLINWNWQRRKDFN